MKNALLILACGLFLTSCFEEDRWTAFVYPDIENIPNAGDVQNYTIGDYKSFEECQEAAVARVNNNYRTTGKQGDYECGLNCTKRDEYGGLLICETDKK
ncbi:MAG: hypothetical protein ACK5X3_23015 [Pseudomonadota bacterium]|jgi:hypothetical protein